MTTHSADFDAGKAGLTLTVELFTLGSDTVAYTAGTVTEQTNRIGVYRAAFTTVAAGIYELRARVTTTPKASYLVKFAGTDTEVVTPLDRAVDDSGNAIAPASATTAIASTLTTILSKLLKYVQLLYRKDAAIATDNATELTEINANGGSGAGSVDNTTDSTQAIAADKDGYKLASDGLDAISTTSPAGVASNFREMGVQLWRRFHKLVRRNKTTKQITQYADDNTTPLVTQSYDDTADEEIVGDAS